jgi:hypothetical protein
VQQKLFSTTSAGENKAKRRGKGVSRKRADKSGLLPLVFSNPSGFRQRTMTTPSSSYQGTEFFTDRRYVECLPRVGRRFADGNGYRSKNPMSVPNAPFLHYPSTTASCVETAHPFSLNVSMMWFSCKLGPLIWGIVACTLRARWISTSDVRCLRSLTGE